MKKILSFLLVFVLIFSLFACGKSTEKTVSKPQKLDSEKVISLAEKGKELTKDDFSGYKCTVEESVYKTYTYKISDRSSVIITADKTTDETKQIYLFCDGQFINLREDSKECKEFLEKHADALKTDK